jgi:hypothetical protein
MSQSIPFDGRQIAGTASASQSLIATVQTASIDLKQTRQASIHFKIQLGTPTNTAVRLATAAVLPNTPTYSNGTLGVGATLTAGSNTTLTVDGSTVALNDRVLVKNQASTFQNGIYTCTQAGSGSVPWILTRATDCDQAAEVAADILVSTTAGTANTGKQFLHHGATIVMGTDAILWEAGEPAGTLTIVISNNRKQHPSNDNLYSDSDGSFVALASTQYLGTIAAVTAAAEFVIVIPYTPFRRLAINYAATTGTGALDAWLTGQG